MLHILPLLLSADVPVIHGDDFQRICLFNVFRRTRQKFFIDLLQGNEPLHTMAHRERILLDEFSAADERYLLKFDDGIFRAFEFEWWHFSGYLQLSFLPNSTERVIAIHSVVQCRLSTRRLPREALFIDLTSNRIQGTVELDHLPSKLEELYLRGNRLSGPIRLNELPGSLTTIDLAFNRDLGQYTVEYGKLPHIIKKICLQRTLVQFVQPEDDCFMVNEAKIFDGLYNQNFLRTALRKVFANAVEESIIESLLSEDPLRDVSVNETIILKERYAVNKKGLIYFSVEKIRSIVTFEFTWWEFCGNLQIDFLPQTIERLTIQHCHQTFQVKTRCLPREVRWLDLSSNELFGSFEIPLLPVNSRTVNVMSNRLSGSIIMLSLPMNLQVLNISNNEELGQEDVWYKTFPKSIETIDVSDTRIRTAHPKRKKYSLKRKTVFIGLVYNDEINQISKTWV